jgi:hypothetical protein
MTPAAPPLSLSAELAALAVGVVVAEVAVPAPVPVPDPFVEPDPEVVPLEVPVPLVDVLFPVALAAAWNAVKFFAAVGLRANTIPLPQWLMGVVWAQKNHTGVVAFVMLNVN